MPFWIILNKHVTDPEDICLYAFLSSVALIQIIHSNYICVKFFFTFGSNRSHKNSDNKLKSISEWE